MAIPILHFWEKYFSDPDEGLGSTYERFVINEVLFKAVKHYRVKTVLESPSFGFTGLSGINSLGLALNDVSVTVNDSDAHRLGLVKDVWKGFDTDTRFDLIDDFGSLPYEDDCFDMAWSFSALWFVKDLDRYLAELNRVSRKVILIMVPNRTGLGYLHQKHTGADDLKTLLKEDYIKPCRFVRPLEKMGWKLMFNALIDCPLWPDIGMSKEDFAKKMGIEIGVTKGSCVRRGAACHTQKSYVHTDSDVASRVPTKPPLSILDYYNGKDTNMKERMLKLNHFEKHAPTIFKKIWAHHHYYLFMKKV
jgi:SAM-dependent methyltransferase